MYFGYLTMFFPGTRVELVVLLGTILERAPFRCYLDVARAFRFAISNGIDALIQKLPELITLSSCLSKGPVCCRPGSNLARPFVPAVPKDP
jgi:hypothetical protein